MNTNSLAWLTEHAGRVLAHCRRQSGDFAFYVPGGDDKYPAFWIRDAVMQARSGLIPERECREMLRVILEHQNGPEERSLAHGLRVEPWAIADHIVLPGFGLEGRTPGAVFFPGTYSSTDDQGTGNYGLRSAADDVYETVRLARLVGAGPDVLERLHRGMLSLTTDAGTGLCWNGPDDWAAASFHDGLRPMGLVALPSCMRFRAARDLAGLYRKAGDEGQAAFYERVAAQLADSIPRLLQRPDGWLNSASELNRQPDVWATSLAVYEGVLQDDARRAACEALLRALLDGSVARYGYLRHTPTWADAEPGKRVWENGPFAGTYGHYQYGGYWPQPVGWYAAAVAEVSRPDAERLADNFLEHTRTHAADGAPYEWINPELNISEGRWYGPSAALPLEAFRRRLARKTP